MPQPTQPAAISTALAAPAAASSPAAAECDDGAPPRRLLDCPNDALYVIASDLGASSAPACLAFSSCCRRLRALCPELLKQLKADREAAAWLTGQRWLFRAHIKHAGQCRNRLKTWRGLWELELSECCKAMLTKRAGPGATKETRWFGLITDWVHMDKEFISIEWVCVAVGVGVERPRSTAPRRLGALRLTEATQPPEATRALTLPASDHYVLFGGDDDPDGTVRLDAIISAGRSSAPLSSNACGFDDFPGVIVNWLELAEDLPWAPASGRGDG